LKRILLSKNYNIFRTHFFNDNLLKKTEFTGWDGFFEYLSGRADEGLVIAIDEFPYLVKEDSRPCAGGYQGHGAGCSFI